MDITIHSSFLPHDDPDASLDFYRDTLGFEVRGDVGYQGMRWITIGPADQPDTAIVLHPPAANPGLTDDERDRKERDTHADSLQPRQRLLSFRSHSACASASACAWRPAARSSWMRTRPSASILSKSWASIGSPRPRSTRSSAS